MMLESEKSAQIYLNIASSIARSLLQLSANGVASIQRTCEGISMQGCRSWIKLVLVRESAQVRVRTVSASATSVRSALLGTSDEASTSTPESLFLLSTYARRAEKTCGDVSDTSFLELKA